MEDVTAVHFERANGVEFASFAIFDGHGGREASHFAKVSSYCQLLGKLCEMWDVCQKYDNF